jgi:hypothetical protein
MGHFISTSTEEFVPEEQAVASNHVFGVSYAMSIEKLKPSGNILPFLDKSIIVCNFITYD